MHTDVFIYSGDVWTSVFLRKKSIRPADMAVYDKHSSTCIIHRMGLTSSEDILHTYFPILPHRSLLRPSLHWTWSESGRKKKRISTTERLCIDLYCERAIFHASCRGFWLIEAKVACVTGCSRKVSVNLSQWSELMCFTLKQKSFDFSIDL